MLFNVLGCKSGFQSHMIYQFFIVKGDPQLLCDCVANGTAAASKFTADGNDAFFHSRNLLNSLYSL